MTYDEKIKCSEIYKIIFGTQVNPDYWNEDAANKLAEIVQRILTCTELVHLIPRGPGNDWVWLLSEVYGVLKRRYSNDPKEFYNMCLVFVVANHKRELDYLLIN